MCLYSIEGTRPWPVKTQNLVYWFGPDEIDAAIAVFVEHYRDAVFPYTPMLLNPVVHERKADGSIVPVGSGVCWATALTNGTITPDKRERVASIGAGVADVGRGDFPQSGLKIISFSETPLAPTENKNVRGGKALYDLTDIDGEDYWPYYLLSGVSYASNVGNYNVAPLTSFWPETVGDGELDDATLDAFIARHTVTTTTMEEAAACWEGYDRHPTLYRRFGNNLPQLDHNLRFYHYCARDFELFDSIGPISMKQHSSQEGFEFLVHGLIPRGSIVLLAGTGGTGKSSIAHQLCCLAATDWRDDETPMWLGQPLVKQNTKGICVYFSGEDGPAIINARNEIFDPEQRANRLMFQRNHFKAANGDEITFAEFLNRLRQMPEVPLLVVDPARKYLTGDEEDAAVVSEFFEAIERFAHERNTSVIVVHHLSKGAKPTSAREVLDELRGSQVFIDRPRVVIGMFREGPRTIVGLAKCNIPPSLGMVTTERVFAHNPKTLNLTQLPGKDGVRGEYVAPTEEE